MQKVEKQIEINAPVEAVFALFSRFDHFARWMKGVKNVELIAAGRTRWTAEAPDGTRLEWEAEMDEREPGRHIAWHSTSGQVAAEGEARFAPTRQGTTLMQLALGYEQPAQAEDASVAALAENLEQRLEDDLIWFRLYAEREAQTPIVEEVADAPIPSAVAPPATGLAEDEPSVHFGSFSGMLRSGQVIRPARPLTAEFEERAAPVAPSRPANVAPAPRARRSALAYALIGLLAILAISLFALNRKKDESADQPRATSTAWPVVTPGGNKQPPQSAPTPRAATATPRPDATPLSAATLEPRATASHEKPAEARELDAGTRETVNDTINSWLAATSDKDVEAQMRFYAPVLERYYLRSNYGRAAVRAEKARRFAQADSVQMSVSNPEITPEQEGRVRVRFRKQYEVTGAEGTQSGEVLQELVLVRSGNGWRIVSERDLRVLR